MRYQGRLCVPNVDVLRNRILEEAHWSRYSIHPGSTKMYHDLRVVFWLEGLKKDIAEFVVKCPNCQQVKVEHQKLGGLLKEIQVFTLKWGDINMDFAVDFPPTQKQYDYIWVVADRLTKSAHFIHVKSTYSVEDYTRIFIDVILCCHGISLSIISDRASQFTSRFWKSFQKGLDTKVKLSTFFISKRMVRRSVLFRILRICLEHVSLILREIGIRICLWWSFLTIIVTIHLYL